LLDRSSAGAATLRRYAFSRPGIRTETQIPRRAAPAHPEVTPLAFGANKKAPGSYPQGTGRNAIKFSLGAIIQGFRTNILRCKHGKYDLFAYHY
jgi:hypothetical protein